MAIYTKEEQFKLIEEDWKNLKLIDNQYEEVCIEAVKHNGFMLEHVKEQTFKICMEAVKETGRAICLVKDQLEEICLEAVRRNGFALEYIKNQTPKICLEAVRQNGFALEYVKEQTPEICLEAVKESIYSFKYVRNQTYDICLEVVKKNGYHIEGINNKTPELYFRAFVNEHSLIYYQNVKDGFEEYIKNNRVKDKIFCDKYFKNCMESDFYFDINSLKYMKNYLFKENSNNKYILRDKTDINILKEIALSNNELILVDTGNIKDIHVVLANKIITKEDLEKGAF